MESIIGHIYEYQSTDIRHIYIIKGIEDKRYVMTRIMLFNDRSSFVDNDYRLSVTVVKQQIERCIITQIYPAPLVKTVKVKFHDGITREVPIGSYIVQYWNAGEWQNIASFPDTLEGNKEAQKLMNDWEWESQLIKLT